MSPLVILTETETLFRTFFGFCEMHFCKNTPLKKTVHDMCIFRLALKNVLLISQEVLIWAQIFSEHFLSNAESQLRHTADTILEISFSFFAKLLILPKRG